MYCLSKNHECNGAGAFVQLKPAQSEPACFVLYSMIYRSPGQVLLGGSPSSSAILLIHRRVCTASLQSARLLSVLISIRFLVFWCSRSPTAQVHSKCWWL